MAKFIMTGLNAYRATLGLSQLTWSDSYYARILAHTKYQVDAQTISHDGFYERAANCRAAAENVAMFGGYKVTDQQGADKFMTMWRTSPGHDANMRNTSVNQAVVAVIYSKQQNAYYSTMFLLKE